VSALYVDRMVKLADENLGVRSRRIRRCDTPVNEEIRLSLLEAMSFESMQADADKMAPGSSQDSWKDNSNFFHKSTNKRWQGVLTDEQVRAYDELALMEPGPQLANWLECSGDLPEQETAVATPSSFPIRQQSPPDFGQFRKAVNTLFA